jgi:hypothetical protein
MIIIAHEPQKRHEKQDLKVTGQVQRHFDIEISGTHLVSPLCNLMKMQI